MRATERPEAITDCRAVDTPTLMKMLCSGRPTAVEIGTKAGARVQVGKRVLWNVHKVQNYLDTVAV